MEPLSIDEWRPSEFLIVAQLEVDKSTIENWGVRVLPVTETEEGAFLRTSSGLLVAFVREEGGPVPGYTLLCGDPGVVTWEEVLADVMSEFGVERSTVTWVPADESDE